MVACAESTGEPSRPERHSGNVVQFVYGTTAGDELSSASTRGRGTVLIFVTTYDLGSQVLAKTVNRILKTHTPRINAGAIVLETAEYSMLADTFRSSLELAYPVAMADAATLEGDGPFGRITRIPTTVVLDRGGRETWRKAGVAEPREIEAALATASRSGFALGP